LALAIRFLLDPGEEKVMQKKSGIEGEGSYSGTKDYNERQRKFIESGKVDEAARDSQPQSESEKHEMQKAERIGKQHAKGEDQK
jgi:hypothetical protein